MAARAPTLDPALAWARVLGRHHLGPRAAAAGTLPDLADDLVGLHGTSPLSPYFSLRARLPGFHAADLDRELYGRVGLVRVKGMRGTVFVVSRRLAPIVVAATRRVVLNRDRGWRGLDDQDYRRAAPAVLAALTQRSLTVPELRATLGGEVDLAAVVGILCDEGRLVRDRPVGGRTSSAFRYRRWEDALPGLSLEADETAATLALVRAYLGTYGPVRSADLTWWSGLPVARVRRALAALGDAVATVRVTGQDGELLMLAEDLADLTAAPAEPDGVALLPELDPLTMGYRDRSRFLDAALRPWVVDRGGNATFVLLVAGRAAGVWDLTDRPGPSVSVLLFDGGSDDRVLRAAAEVGAFWFGRDVPVQQRRSMTPLTRRGPWVRHPLREPYSLPADPGPPPAGTTRR